MPRRLAALLLLFATAAAAAAGPRNCGEERPYIKRIAALQFRVADARQLADLPELGSAYPLALLEQLRFSGDFATSDGTPYTVEIPGDPAGESKLIRRVADLLGAQFVVTGEIRDAGVTGSEAPVVSYFFKPKRRLEVHLALYDGYTGTLLNEHRHQMVMSGELRIPEGTPTASAAFYASQYGALVGDLLTREVAALRDDLACLPLAARIVQVDGSEVTIDAGAAAGLRPGDRLTVFRRTIPSQIEIDQGLALENQEMRVANLLLKRVQPRSAVGRLDRELPSTLVAPGDLVRAP